ncbi:hypothetical protein JCM10914A_05910 [Paenibacillus sp. JCM 10914]|uniref:hypothetical protein n=1 Tax=Paenibacillus sp. JCM 10914 TaxID=1236974 RepID=UPI0005629E21|nr:hypothetical protein [Paenibacillus sp. JCM 10914]
MKLVKKIGDLFWVDLKSLDIEKTQPLYREWFGWSFRNENWGHRNQTVIYSGSERVVARDFHPHCRRAADQRGYHCWP